jgi:hypothetical protein
MSFTNIIGLAPDDTAKRIRVNQQGQLLSATADFVPNGSILLGSPQATALQTGSVPLATADTVNHREGWYYRNEEAGNKINWFMYDGTAKNLTFGELTQLTATMAIDGTYPPFFVVYTKGTTHGWYGKRVIFQNQASINYIMGQKCLMYYSATAFNYPQNALQLREIACPILVPASDVPDPADEILYITLQSDSSFAPDSFAGVISEFGFQFSTAASVNTVQYRLDAPVSSGTGSDVNITNTYLDTHATLYLNGAPVDSGTNSLPVVISGSSSVEISAANGDPLTATGTALDVANPSLTSMTFDKGTDLQVKVVSQPIPINNYGPTGDSAAVCRIVDTTNTAFTNTVAGALDVCVVNTSDVAVSNASLTAMTFSTENNLYVQLATAAGEVGDGNPLIVQNTPTTLQTYAWTLADFSDGGNPGSVSPTITSGKLSTITIFGSDTNSTGMSSPYLVYQYCLTDSATPSDWVDTLPYVSLPNGGTYYDSRTPVVPFLRLKIMGFISPPGPVVDTLVLNVCYK